MFPSQSNTQPGARPFIAGADLSAAAKEGLLIKLTSVATVPTVNLPTAVTDITHFVLVDGDVAGRPVQCQPLTPGENLRIRAKGAGVAGDLLVMADPTANAGADAGKVIKLPAAAGIYVLIGTAEEDFADGQLVLTRPRTELIVVPSVVAPPAAVTSGQVATAAAVDLATSEALANALKAAFNLAQNDIAALRATVAGLQTALVANAQIKSA